MPTLTASPDRLTHAGAHHAGPASPDPDESAHDAPGTLLAVVAVDGTMLVIVGYLLRGPHRAGWRPPATAVDGLPALPAEGLAAPPAEGLVVDRANRQVLVGGSAIGLTFQEFELLDFLTSNPGRIFSRAQLLDFVWGHSFAGLTRTVDVHIHRLRRKLGPEYARCFVTERRVGYRFQPRPR
jgi:DNA-binding response OmpR family regulator